MEVSIIIMINAIIMRNKKEANIKGGILMCEKQDKMYIRYLKNNFNRKKKRKDKDEEDIKNILKQELKSEIQKEKFVIDQN